LKKKELLVLFAILAIGLLSRSASAATEGNYDPSGGGGTVVPVVLSTTYYDNALWENEFAGSKGWSSDTWVLTITGEHGKGIEIDVSDGFWVGDSYSVWIVDTATGTTIFRVLTTPAVKTDWHEGGTCPFCGVTMPCPVGNPLHTGTGTVYSEGIGYIFLNPGTYEFKVRDELFDVLAGEGFNPSSYPGEIQDPTCPLYPSIGWSPAGFWVGFHYNPRVIPEVPVGTVMSAVAMIVALVAYIGTKHTPVFLRRP